MPKAISPLAILLFLVFAAPASAWEQDVVNTTATLMNGHCVSPNAPNTVYLLNATSGDQMSAIEERKAMSALTMAFLDHGRFQVTRGEVLKYEAYMAENTGAGREKLKDTMARLSNSTITIFFVPVDRDNNYAYADVVFLARNGANEESRLGCGPSITVEIPVGDSGTETLKARAERFVVDYLALWGSPDDAYLDKIWSLFEEPVDFYGEMRTVQGIYNEKVEIARTWPERRYDLLRNSLEVRCEREICEVKAHYIWQVDSPTLEARNGRSTLTMTLRKDGNGFKIIAEDGDVY